MHNTRRHAHTASQSDSQSPFLQLLLWASTCSIIHGSLVGLRRRGPSQNQHPRKWKRLSNLHETPAATTKHQALRWLLTWRVGSVRKNKTGYSLWTGSSNKKTPDDKKHTRVERWYLITPTLLFTCLIEVCNLSSDMHTNNKIIIKKNKKQNKKITCTIFI